MKNIEEIKKLIEKKDVNIWKSIVKESRNAESFAEIMTLSTLRKRAEKIIDNKADFKKIRLAILGGYSLYPLGEIVDQYFFANECKLELWVGDYDNYHSEILDEKSELYKFNPDIIVIIPAERRNCYIGSLRDDKKKVKTESEKYCEQLIELTKVANKKTQAEIILCNFMPTSYYDMGSYRNKTLSSAWNFTMNMNLELGLTAPSFVHICDINFLSSRIGLENCRDERAWYESKQIGSPQLLVSLGKEIAHIALSIKTATKKVLVLDLDNTLWGGTIGDDGIDGIEIGDTTPRGEAFKAFQKYILSLIDRGVILAVCSKNDIDNAMEPFERHPEMVLRKKDIVSFVANWNPKSDNIKSIADDLKLGLDSFVFVDDNPAEIEIVNQFLPQVSTIQLSEDPSKYVEQLADSRFFEPLYITNEDIQRTELYKQKEKYKELEMKVTNMEEYLESLEMKAKICNFSSTDNARIAQLINKSNQFNLTSKRRNETEVALIAESQNHIGFTIRLKDKFSEHGLISVLIAEIINNELLIDTWLMSCRVLKRQVEAVALNELISIAKAKNCNKIRGLYIETTKNGMVKDLYKEYGFEYQGVCNDGYCYSLNVDESKKILTHIVIDKDCA